MINKRSIVSIACLALLLFYSCNKKPEKISRSFCFWKTSLETSSAEDSLLNFLSVDHFYVRYFDVDWNPFQKEALPVGTISKWYSCDLTHRSFTPSVFITNSVMENASAEQLNDLAAKIKTRVVSIDSSYSERYSEGVAYPYSDYLDRNENLNKDSLKTIRDSVTAYAANEFQKKIKDILIDCDWTEKTKAKYFAFLKKIKEQFPDLNISATVRLWQYKDRTASGIPPVDRCLLMCYNLNNPAQYSIKNSICSLEELKKYIVDDSYPVPMDVALPVFNSGSIFRNGVFKGLVSNINLADYQKDTVNYKQLKENTFMFKTEQIIGNTLIRYGDELRIDQLTTAELSDISDFLSSNLKLNENSRVTFFSWDTSYIKNYSIENIKKYYHLFEH